MFLLCLLNTQSMCQFLHFWLTPNNNIAGVGFVVEGTELFTAYYTLVNNLYQSDCCIGSEIFEIINLIILFRDTVDTLICSKLLFNTTSENSNEVRQLPLSLIILLGRL